MALRRWQDEMEKQLEPGVARISADHVLATKTKAALDIFVADLSVTRSRDEFSACAAASILDINQYSVRQQNWSCQLSNVTWFIYVTARLHIMYTNIWLGSSKFA
jgi:hypothetical protein